MPAQHIYIFAHDTARKLAAQACMDAPDGYMCIIKPKTRTLEQNARLWAMLGDIAAQVVWHGRKLQPEEWKHIFTAALKKQDVVLGIDGGFVVLGQSTSRMTAKELGELMTLMEAFGADHGVKFRDCEAV